MTLTVPCLFGLESLVADEMRRLNLGGVRAENGRVHCEGTMADIARLNINLRCGARVLMELGQNTIPILALHRTIITYYNRIWVHLFGAQPQLSTPQWFLFSVPRLLIAAAGSMGLIYLGRFLKKTYQQRKTAASH